MNWDGESGSCHKKSAAFLHKEKETNFTPNLPLPLSKEDDQLGTELSVSEHRPIPISGLTGATRK